MATLLLSAAGAAAGSAIGGTAFGLTSTVIGRAVGATLGRALDQRLLGAGAEPVETGQIDRFRLSGASEGAPMTQLWGGMRLPGQVIWASRFLENSNTTGGGGKGTASKQPTVTNYSYSVSLAMALCEGAITRIGRVWADGVEISKDDLNMSVYSGSADQLPDPKIEAIEGVGMAPAYRGTAYVVLEDLDLGRFGNRVPQLNFEVFRAAQPSGHKAVSELLRGVALVPGTGEYSLATTPVHFSYGPGDNRSINVNTPSGKTDFATSLEQLTEAFPNCGSGVLVVSWFGDDLRAGQCQIKPKVEQTAFDGVGQPWQVAGQSRASAEGLSQVDGRPVFGGTPGDTSVREALRAMVDAGQSPIFYPFILMELLEGNGKPNPWAPGQDQPVIPWRGRITSDIAFGQLGSTQESAGVEEEVDAFFGSVIASDFAVSNGTLSYSGPEEWSYSRFILHYAALCAAEGGLGAFCIGSELLGLTQIMSAGRSFPVVARLRALAAEVRALLGQDVKLGYAADWSEYFGYHPQDGSGDVLFHLDPLWADPNIDFIGIDNYMPLSDWREGFDHLDAEAGAIHALDYLTSNVEGGEGYDWFYANEADREGQRRTPIIDDAYGENWVFRYKDIRNWWEQPHHERIDGARAALATPWLPRSKPIWFTEFGCAAIDKGTNEPNKFLDVMSSESALPRYSTGARDDLIQSQYLRAVLTYWKEPAHNPVSEVYGGPMIDLSRAHAWAWDARPWPAFPNNLELWQDGGNHARGHWLSGRDSAQSLAAVIAEICERNGIAEYDVDQVHGLARGFAVTSGETGRSALQQLSLAHGLDVCENEGRVCFALRTASDVAVVIDPGRVVARTSDISDIERIRAPEAEVSGRVRVNFVDGANAYGTSASEARFPDELSRGAAQTDLAMVLLPTEARAVAERWLSEARVARDGVSFALPHSATDVVSGGLVQIAGDPALYRVDRVEDGAERRVDATRVEPSIYRVQPMEEEAVEIPAFVAPVPVQGLFLDLPLLTGEEAPQAPHLAVAAKPWPGAVAVYSASADSGYVLDQIIAAGATIGLSETGLPRAMPSLPDLGPGVRVRFPQAVLQTVSWEQVLQGANFLAIGDGSPGGWELLQFQIAQSVSPGVYDLSVLLRGQFGTEAEMPSIWPVGSYVVVIDRALLQLDYPSSMRGLIRHFRIGPSGRGYYDASYTHHVHAFEGRGLRPYSPAHLRGVRDMAGDLHVNWVRRGRIDADRWDAGDIPLGETTESYLLRVVQEGTVMREEVLSSPSWLYPVGLQAVDGVVGPFELMVAQISDRFGPGPFGRMTQND